MTTPDDADDARPGHVPPDHAGWGSAPRGPELPPTPPSTGRPADPFGAPPAYPGAPDASGYGPPPLGQVPPGYGHGYGPQPPSSGKAVASMVVGIISILFCYLGLILGIVAICLSVSSRNDIRRAGPQLRGEGFATAGLVTGIIGTVIWGLVLVFIIIGVSVGA